MFLQLHMISRLSRIIRLSGGYVTMTITMWNSISITIADRIRSLFESSICPRNGFNWYRIPYFSIYLNECHLNLVSSKTTSQKLFVHWFFWFWFKNKTIYFRWIYHKTNHNIIEHKKTRRIRLSYFWFRIQPKLDGGVKVDHLTWSRLKLDTSSPYSPALIGHQFLKIFFWYFCIVIVYYYYCMSSAIETWNQILHDFEISCESYFGSWTLLTECSLFLRNNIC